MARNGKDIDLVVGAKGSPTQLILSSIYQTDVPTGNISVADARLIEENDFVELSIPLSIGDSYKGTRVVGTSEDYIKLYAALFETGKIWSSENQLVLGSKVAKKFSLALGDELNSTHGLSGGSDHEEHGLIVVGILKPSSSVLDDLILTSTETIWSSHTSEKIDLNSLPPHLRQMAAASSRAKDEKEYTALLIQYASSAAAASFPRYVNSQTNMQAASPAVETTRLFSLLDSFFMVVRAFAALLILASILGLFVAMYNALKDRMKDIAIIRSLGGSRSLVLKHMLLEGLLISFAGASLGIILAHIAVGVFGAWTAATRGITFSALYLHPAELLILLGAVCLGLIAACIPAWQAYQSDIRSSL